MTIRESDSYLDRLEKARARVAQIMREDPKAWIARRVAADYLADRNMPREHRRIIIARFTADILKRD